MSIHGSARLVAFSFSCILAASHAWAQSSPDQQLAEAEQALARTPDDVHWLKQAGVAAHQQAKLRVQGAARKAVSYLERADARTPNDVETLAYLGSANAMVGREGASVFEKLRRTNQGLELLDRAVHLAPENLRVRLIRAGVSYEVPAMFRRKSIALEDYRYVITSAGVHSLPPDVQAEICFKLGTLMQDQNDRSAASSYFQQAKAVSPNSQWALRADPEHH